jgi:hypothetical protein
MRRLSRLHFTLELQRSDPKINGNMQYNLTSVPIMLMDHLVLGSSTIISRRTVVFGEERGTDGLGEMVARG